MVFSLFFLFFLSQTAQAQISATIQTILTDKTFPATPPTNDPFTFYAAIPTKDQYWDCKEHDSYPVLGGKNNAYYMITQSITIVPPYYSLTVSFSLYQLDVWAASAWTAAISGTTYLSYSPSLSLSKICGVANSHNSTQKMTVGKFVGSSVLITYTAPYEPVKKKYSRFAMRNFISTVLLCNSRCLACTSYTYTSCTTCINNANITANCICNKGFYNVSCGTLKQTPICIDKCLACDPSCLTCSGGSNTSCTSCSGGYTLSSGSCISALCPLTSYVDSNPPFLCVACSFPCNTCLNSTFCYSCVTTTSTYYLLESKGKCLTVCPLGTFAQTQPNVCQTCDSNCVTCSMFATQCTSCVSGEYVTANYSCQPCQSGTYFDTTLSTCRNCDPSCITCNGSTANNCLSCNSSAFMVLMSDGTCDCMLGTYNVNSTFCDSCDATCFGCSGGDSLSCVSCSSDRYLSNGQCLCYEGNYSLTDGTGSCAYCDVSCTTCSNSPTTCTSCSGNLTLVDNQCLIVCSAGTYLSSVTCVACSQTCQTCNGSEAYNCLSCYSGMQVLGGYGYCQCTNGTYLASVSPSVACVSCSLGCATCYGIATSCTSCQTGLMLDTGTSTCNACPSGTYFSNGACSNCYAKCDTCSGPLESNCLTCKGGMNFTNGSCVCSPGYYWSQTNLLFELCDLNCLTCFGSSTNCTSCSSNKTLDTSTHTCFCSNDTFYDTISGYCLKCDSNCLTCKGTGVSDCLLCKDPQRNLAFGSCVLSCPENYFPDSSHVCQICPKFCKKCLNSTMCNICFDGYVLNSQNSCVMQKKVYANMTTVTNPTAFLINFSERWSYLMDNIQNLMNVTINGLPNNNFTYTISNNNNSNSSLILINYKNNLNGSTLTLNVTITINYSAISSEFILVDNKFQSSLQSYINCPQNYYYDSSSKSCRVKNSIQATLGLLENHLQISLSFSYFFRNFFSYLKTYSSVTIQGKTLKTDFNYSFTQNSNSSYIININTTKPIINRPKLTFCMNFPLEIITQYNLAVVSNCQEIGLFDWYPLSETDQKNIENSKKQTQVNSVMSANGMSTILASSSGIFLFGLMMMEMIYFLKYINVNYPLNALSLFESKQSSYVLFFQYSFKMEPDSFVLPDIYTYYQVSPYFLNNTGEVLSEIFAVFVIAIAILCLNMFIHGRIWFVSTLFGFIGRILIWELVILFVFLSIQKLFFYATCALCFFPVTTNGVLNSMCALLISLILIGWIACLFYHNKQCQDYRAQIELSFKVKKTEHQSEPLTPQTILKDSQKNSPTLFSIREYKQAKINKKNDIISLDSSKNKVHPFVFNVEEMETSKSANDITFSNGHSNASTYRIKDIPLNKPETIKEQKTTTTKIKTFFRKCFKNKISSCFIMIFAVKNWIRYLKKYSTLFEDLQNKTFWQKYFKLFYYSKQILISILVPALHKFPLVQMNLITIIYFGFLMATIIKNPFDSRIIWIINIISEFICLSSICSVLTIAFLDYNGNQDYQLKMNLGWVIIYANIALLYWVMVSGVIKILLHFYFKYKQYKFNRKITSMG